MSVTPAEKDTQERLDFIQQPTLEDFRFQVIRLDTCKEAGRLVLDTMDMAIEGASQKFGVRFEDTVLPAAEDPRIPYNLVGPVDLSDPQSLSTAGLVSQLVRGSHVNVRTNLANFYDPESGQLPQDVQKYDMDNHCNTIFADEKAGDFMVVTAADILDNIVCETIRLKYKATRDMTHGAADRLERAKTDTESLIREIASIFHSFNLYHRDARDGAILIRHSKDILVSQTLSIKPILHPKDFSLITYADPERNEVRFAGQRLPSSDAPELLELMRLMENAGQPLPKLVIHFHHPTYTRSGQFTEHETNEEIEYGVFTSGHAILEELQVKDSNWLLLKNHGFLWMGNTVKEFRDFIEYLHKDEPRRMYL